MNDVEVEVLFVDYGNKEVVNVRNLRRTHLFAKLPIQRHVCALADVEPVSNTRDEIFHNFRLR
jgi:hypothetical protein